MTVVCALESNKTNKQADEQEVRGEVDKGEGERKETYG